MANLKGWGVGYNPEIRHRRAILLKDYDYSQEGAYFVTICTHNRECLLSQIENAGILLNDAGEMVKKWWLEIQKKFNTVEMDVFMDVFVVMWGHVATCPT